MTVEGLQVRLQALCLGVIVCGFELVFDRDPLLFPLFRQQNDLLALEEFS